MLDYVMGGYNNQFEQKHIHTLVQYKHFSLNHKTNMMIADRTEDLGNPVVTTNV